jgi:hypothetical protein
MRNVLPFNPRETTMFPVGDYTPYGYLHTPNHRGLNPSGILRSVPPLGFGIFNRGLPWYGMDGLKAVNNYLSILKPSLTVGKIVLSEREHFDNAGIKLCSRYHTGNVMSYDFKIAGMVFSLAWYRLHDDALGLRVYIQNKTNVNQSVIFNVSHLYGMNGRKWWGSDAVTSRYVQEKAALISKILAYGDVFALLSESSPLEGVTTSKESILEKWIKNELSLDGGYQAVHLPNCSCGALRWEWIVPSGNEIQHTVILARGVNEQYAIATAHEALQAAETILRVRLDADDEFYTMAPLLDGDWAETWKHGWIYDFETLRMNLMAPAGIYHHVWDGMQALWPRVVIGETSIDMLTMSYANIETALEVITGMFEDAPDVYVPCTREDGSVNMIGEDGSECATAPIWGMPIRAIRIMLARSGNISWIKRIYPKLKLYLDWWRQNRTDNDGWFHCNNSWESGQDGSARFVTDADSKNGPKEAANVEHVRTADLEAAMASAFDDMALFAKILGYQDDETSYHRLAHEGRKRTISMFVEKCFRDFDARNGKPFVVNERYDMMLTMPLALGVATDQQKTSMKWLFKLYSEEIERIFIDSEYLKSTACQYAPYWPPLLQTVVEAAHEMGDLEISARMVVHLIDPAYRRNDSRKHLPAKPMTGIPERYSMYIPGNGRENLSEDFSMSGCENYGWGCLAPMMIFENIIGLRPLDPLGREFALTPVLPDVLTGKIFKINNVRHGPFRFDLVLERQAGGIKVIVRFLAKPQNTVYMNMGSEWLEAENIDVLLPPVTKLKIRG